MSIIIYFTIHHPQNCQNIFSRRGMS